MTRSHRGPAVLFAAGLLLVHAGAAESGVRSLTSGTAAAHAEAPPPRHTGGFGEPTCQACHAEYGLNVAGGSLGVSGLPDRWEPGVTYALTVTLSSSEMERAGFELAVRREDGTQAGTLAPHDARTAVTVAEGVEYAHQTEAGADVDSPEIATWSVAWTAPHEGGVVRIHAAANSANGDNSPFGDLIYASAFEASAAAAPASPRR